MKKHDEPMKKLMVQIPPAAYEALDFMAKQCGIGSATALVTGIALNEAESAMDYAKRLASGEENAEESKVIKDAAVRARVAAEDLVARMGWGSK